MLANIVNKGNTMIDFLKLQVINITDNPYDYLLICVSLDSPALLQSKLILTANVLSL